MVTERNTYQKQIILDYLINTKSHPSAETIFIEVKKKIPTISQATVYRILNNLVVSGKVRQIDTAIKRFDADISTHDHFICKKCNCILDIFNKKNKLKNKIKNIGQVESQQTYFYGVCNKCLKINK